MNIRSAAPAAPTTPPPSQIQQERALLESTLWGVVANTLRAMFAGLGVALLVVSALWWMGFEPPTVGRTFLRIWGITSGILLFVLHSSDRIAFVISQWNLHNALVDIDHAEDTIESLQADLATTKHDNALLSFRIQELERNRNFTPATSPETPAYRDARELIRAWAKTGEHPSRRRMGWTDTRHSAAMWVLQQRQIVTVGKGNIVTWIAPDAATALSILASNQSLPENWPTGATSTSQSTEGDEP